MHKNVAWHRAGAVGVLAVFLSCSTLNADQPPRYPQGVYVIVSPGDINDLPNILGNNPWAAGFLVSANWGHLNPNAPTSTQLPDPLDCSHLPPFKSTDTYNWTLTDAAFCAALSASPTRNVQLYITPGYGTPRWVMDQININSCSGKFVFLPQPYLTPSNPLPPLPPDPTPTCHLAYFVPWEGQPTYKIDGVVQTPHAPLPLPWDATYKSAWQTFLIALNARYGQNPAFASIAIGGPTATSDEILLPEAPGDVKSWRTILMNQFSNPLYRDSDQAFIDEWKHAIDMFGQTFNGVTFELVTASDGLPDFGGPYTLPDAAKAVCESSPTMNCGALYSILSYFIGPGAGGRNARAVAHDGLSAIPYPVAAIPYVKQVTVDTEQTTRILGGAQSGGPFPTPTDSLFLKRFTCPDATEAAPDCSPQQSLYNTLADFFASTHGEHLFPRIYDPALTDIFPGGTKPGGAPLNYLQIYRDNIPRASDSSLVNSAPGIATTYSGQDQLILASQALALTAETPLPVPVPTPEGIIDDLNQLRASGAITMSTDSLLDKLPHAPDGKGNDCGGHSDRYKAFIDAVLDRIGSGITPAAAAVLIGDALYLVAHCS